MNKLKLFLLNKHTRHWIAIIIFMAVSVFSVNLNYETNVLFNSITDLPEHAPFDGTVMPIQVAPDWTNLDSDEYDMPYSQIPSDKLEAIPEYRNDYFTFDSDDLVWGDTTHDVIRNTKITYPVAYLDNYKFDDSGENVGSHPAVDIKVPEFTPVSSIANGVVTEAGYSSSWGYHVVVKHSNVPDPDNPDLTTDLYSSYSHMSDIFVKEGQILTKGETIGEVGDTGTATTYHLHFQIDLENAPWHPYWPFTSADTAALGLNFWDGVNQGVGLENAYAYTTNPMKYVQSYLSQTEAIEVVEEEEVVVEEEEEVVVEEEEEVVVEEEPETAVVIIDFENIAVDVQDFIITGESRVAEVTLLDANGEIVENPQYDGRIEVSLSDETVGRLDKSFLGPEDFDEGIAELNFYADHEGNTDINFEIAGETFSPMKIYVIDEIEPFFEFGIETDGLFKPGVAETVRIISLDVEGVPTPKFDRSGTVELNLAEGSGSFSLDELDEDDFTHGIAEVEFIADEDDDVIVQVIFGSKVAESNELRRDELFSDLESTHDFYGAVSYLYSKGVIEGYPDGTFKPDTTVNRIEALKFIFGGLDQALESGLSFNFTDAFTGQWYSDYLATASSLGVVGGYEDGSFKPTQGVNRVEFLKMLLATVDISVDPVVTEDPYNDVNNLSWYAPYVQYAKENDLFPVDDSNFEPSKEMSRIEVAEVIYRMINAL